MSLGKCFICSLTIQCQGSDDPVKDLTEVREEQSRRTTTVCLETWFSTSLERHGIFSKKNRPVWRGEPKGSAKLRTPQSRDPTREKGENSPL
jgi:hypothetical protein